MRRVRPVWVAAAWLLLWGGALALLRPGYIVDEAGHQAAINRLAAGDWSGAPYLVMLPGFHLLVAALTWWPGPSLAATRAVSLALSLATVWLLDGAARRRDGEGGGAAVLLLALLPAYFPLTALAYTDAAGIFFLVAAVAARARGRDALGAAALLGSCLVRQSGVAWALLLAGWAIRDGRRWRGAAGYLAVAAVTGVAMIASGGLLSETVPENRPRFNPGNLVLLAVMALILWAPLWLARAGGELRRLATALGRRPGAVLLGGGGLAAATALTALTFGNRHPWNQDPAFLHNLPLVWMDGSAAARWAGAGAVALAGLLLGRLWWDRGRAVLPALLAGATALYLLPHALADLRYLAAPWILADLLAGHGEAERRWLGGWYGVLAVATAGLLLSRRLIMI